MHIVLGLLGIIVTILILLNRLQQGGIDIGWLNPFAWHRRRKFRNEYHLSAAYSLDKPMDVAALFLVGIAKSDGEMSKEQKDALLALFESEFKLSTSKAQDLLGGSVHILGRGDELFSSPSNVLHKSKESFSAEQVDSVVDMMKRISNLEGNPNAKQLKLIEDFKKCFPKEERGGWQN